METEAVAARGAREAYIQFGQKGDSRTVRVLHPGRLTAGDVAAINKHLVEKVIFDLTGCSCLSGTIDVIWERNFDRVINVTLDKVGAPVKG